MREGTIDPVKVSAFLADLTALTLKYGIEAYNSRDDKAWSGLKYVRP